MPEELRQIRFAPPPGSTQVVLVRHGESAPHVPGRPFALRDGHGDPPLSELGRWQAEQVGERLKDEAITAIYVSTLDPQILQEAFAEAASSEHDASELASGVALVDVLATTTLASSKRQAREFLSNGAISVNGEKASADTQLSSANLLDGDVILLRRGRKAWHVTRWR